MEFLEKSFLNCSFCFGGSPGALSQIATDKFKGQIISEVPKDKKMILERFGKILNGSDRATTYVWEVNAMPDGPFHLSTTTTQNSVIL